MSHLTRVISDTTTVTSTAASTMRARSLVVTGQKLKPFTNINVFFDSTVMNSRFVPCAKIVINSTFTFKGYLNANNQTNDILKRTTGVATYDVMEKGDILECDTGSAVVVVHETIYNRTTFANENVLYVTNIKGTITGAIRNSQYTASGTVLSVSLVNPRTTNSLGNLYGVLNIPASTFAAGTGKVLFSDSASPEVSTASTSAENTYLAQGVVTTTARNIISEVIVIHPAPPPPRGGDPLAQTFAVPTEQFNEGAFITSVDIFFASFAPGDPSPVEVQIVETLNGYPTQNIVEWGQSIKASNEMVASGTSLVPTRFKFDNLVKLEEGKEYAIKILTNSITYRVWTSFIGDAQLGNPASLITQQPHLGSFFKSQNNSTWTPEQLQDLTFVLNYAKFNTDVIGKPTLVENVQSLFHTLPANPFRTTNGQSKVVVNQPSHGFEAGLNVVFSDSTVFNSKYNITRVINSDLYVIDVITVQTANDNLGGSGVKVQKSIKFDGILVTGFEESRSAGIKATARLSSKLSRDAEDTDLTPDIKTDLLANKFLHTSTNKADFLQNAPSFELKFEMSSTNPAMSPIIDLDRVAVGLLGSRINSPSQSDIDFAIDGDTLVVGVSNISFTATTNIITVPVTTDYSKIKRGAWIKVVDTGGLNNNKTGYVSKIDTSLNQLTLVGDALVTEAARSATIIQYASFISETANLGTAESKYICKQVTLATPSKGFRVIFGANIPTETEIDMYYRISTASSVDPLTSRLWINFPITYKKTAVETEFTEFEYNIPNLVAFDTFQFKFVLRSTNTAVTPKLRKLRIIAHA